MASDRVRPQGVQFTPKRGGGGIGPTQRLLLESLGVGAATIKTLAERTGLSRGSVRDALARLEARGLVAPTGAFTKGAGSGGGVLVWRRIEGDAMTEMKRLEDLL